MVPVASVNSHSTKPGWCSSTNRTINTRRWGMGHSSAWWRNIPITLNIRRSDRGLRPQGLSEGDPESVHVTDDELMRAIKRIMNIFEDFDTRLYASVQFIDVVGSDVQVDLATAFHAWFPA